MSEHASLSKGTMLSGCKLLADASFLFCLVTWDRLDDTSGELILYFLRMDKSAVISELAPEEPAEMATDFCFIQSCSHLCSADICGFDGHVMKLSQMNVSQILIL